MLSPIQGFPPLSPPFKFCWIGGLCPPIPPRQLPNLCLSGAFDTDRCESSAVPWRLPQAGSGGWSVQLRFSISIHHPRASICAAIFSLDQMSADVTGSRGLVPLRGAGRFPARLTVPLWGPGQRPAVSPRLPPYLLPEIFWKKSRKGFTFGEKRGMIGYR